MTTLLERRFKRITEAYARLLKAYTYSNRRDRQKLIAEAELLLADAKWGFLPPLGYKRDD